MSGRCHYGERCEFSHDADVIAKAKENAHVQRLLEKFRVKAGRRAAENPRTACSAVAGGDPGAACVQWDNSGWYDEGWHARTWDDASWGHGCPEAPQESWKESDAGSYATADCTPSSYEAGSEHEGVRR